MAARDWRRDAEMPGFYPDGEYDLAGFMLAVVERERIITGKDVQIGTLFWLGVNGLHTNGYSWRAAAV